MSTYIIGNEKWEVAHYAPCGHCVRPVVPADSTTPASIAVCYGPHSKENAQAIAALPALLAAAKLASLELDYLVDGLLHDSKDVKHAAIMLREAINKASIDKTQ